MSTTAAFADGCPCRAVYCSLLEGDTYARERIMKSCAAWASCELDMDPVLCTQPIARPPAGLTSEHAFTLGILGNALEDLKHERAGQSLVRLSAELSG